MSFAAVALVSCATSSDGDSADAIGGDADDAVAPDASESSDADGGHYADSETTPDADVSRDTSFFVPTYSPSDVNEFDYSFFGTGLSEHFLLDRDCGIAADAYDPGSGSATGGTGIVAPDDCNEFKAYLVSPEVIRAFISFPPCTGFDDYPSFALRLTERTYLSEPTACSDMSPWGEIEAYTRKLRDRYAVPDAGIDADSDAPADDGGDSAP